MKENYKNTCFKKIEEAEVYDVAIKSPLEFAKNLSKRLGNKIFLKREDLQPVFSFKLRGAYNKISKLIKAKKIKKLVAASAGNHAQGVALAAKKLSIKACIVMPKSTPEIKIEAVKSLKAEVILYGDSYDDAYDYALKKSKSSQIEFVHPYDDLDVIAGQGTIGIEIINQIESKPDYIFVPVGGGDHPML